MYEAAAPVYYGRDSSARRLSRDGAINVRLEISKRPFSQVSNFLPIDLVNKITNLSRYVMAPRMSWHNIQYNLLAKDHC